MQFFLVQVGTYKVSVKAAGFMSYTTEVTLAAADRTSVNARLSLGSTTDTVKMQATTPALQSDCSTMGTLIDTPVSRGVT